MKLSNKFKEYLKYIFDKENDDVVNMIHILFSHKNTKQSIDCFNRLKKEFEIELSRRNIEALEVNTLCEDYFKNNKTN